jgi:hypothetical protein
MEGEQPTIAAPELASPAIEAPVTTTEETTTPDEPERIPSPEEASEEQQAAEAAADVAVADDSDDIEFGFKKYRVPKDLKVAIEDWRSATTKKEQTVSERAKALEAQAAQQVEADETELNARRYLGPAIRVREAYAAGLAGTLRQRSLRNATGEAYVRRPEGAKDRSRGDSNESPRRPDSKSAAIACQAR